MLNLKDNPVSIDYELQQIQEQLHAALMEAWGLNPATPAENEKYQCYGRCNRNLKPNNGGYVAEVFTGDATTQRREYKEVYWDDKLVAVSFFGLGERILVNNENVADIHLVFFVDLEKLALKDHTGATIKHRADEEIHNQVQKIFGRSLQGARITSIETGLVNVLKEYSGSFRDDRLKTVDMQPRHCFRFNFTMEFDINANCKPFKNF